MDALFKGDQGKQMEASFKTFIERPEHMVLLEKHQRKEMKQALQVQEHFRAVDFQDKVLSAEYDAQRNIAPFMGSRVLRRLVQTFTNDPNADFSKWANNPRVIGMLREAKRLLDKGIMTEDEMEHGMIAQMQQPEHEFHDEFKRSTRQVVRLPTDQLVGALNEHLTERRKGNDKYRAKHFPEALHHYRRAASIVEFVTGFSRADQEEIDANKAAVYLNIAAVHLALKEFGAAESFCTKAVDLNVDGVKARLRRAKAYIGQREFEKALADLGAVAKADPGNPEREEQMRYIKSVTHADRRAEKEFVSQMFA